MLGRRPRFSPIGIDFRDTSIVMAQYRRVRDRWRLHAFGERRYEPPAEHALAMETVAAALASMLDCHDFEGKAVAASLPSAHVETRPVRLPAGILSEEHPSFFPALINEARTFLLFDPSEAVLDYLPMGVERYEEEERFNVLLFASRTEIVADYLKLLGNAGFHCESLEFSPCAFLHAAPAAAGTRVLIELNAANTSVSIISDGRLLFNRIVRIGMGGAVDLLAQNMNAAYSQAWTLLQHYGVNHQAVSSFKIDWVLECGAIGHGNIGSTFFQVGRDVFEKIANEIRRSLNYYLNHRHGSPVEEICLAGEMIVPGLADFFRDRFGFPVRMPDASHAADAEPSPTIAGGLAMGEIRRMKLHVDMVPPEYRESLTMKRKTSRWIGTIAALMIAVAALSWPVQLRLHRLDESNRQMRQIVTDGAAIPGELAALEGEIQAAYERYQIYLGYLDEPQWDEVFRSLAASSSERLWLGRLVVSEDKDAAPADSKGASGAIAHRMVIEGYAADDKNVVDFMRNLEQANALSKIELMGTTAVTDPNNSAKVHFTLGSEVH